MSLDDGLEGNGGANGGRDMAVAGVLLGSTALDKELNLGSIGQIDDKYEYYTSEDEQGRRIQKMRRKRKPGRHQGANQAGRSRDRRGRSRDNSNRKLQQNEMTFQNSQNSGYQETGRGRSFTNPVNQLG